MIRVLKNSPRSRVTLIRYQDQQLVYKIPVEKNRRYWSRFTTLYRQSEAFRCLRSLDLLKKLKIRSNQGLVAVEKRRWGMVIDSYVIYDYLTGKSVAPKDLPAVIEYLDEVHHTQHIHGDAQQRNFIIQDQQVAIIDATPQRKFSFRIWKMYEYCYLKASMPGCDEYFVDIKDPIAYKIARTIHQITCKWRQFKDRLKGR